MSSKIETIEVDAETAATLKARAKARGVSVSSLLAEIVGADVAWPADLDALRKKGRGPWSPEILAEDARRLAEFERAGEGVPWDEVKVWIESWGTPDELPPPKPRKL
jgi:predicted transcriptional regulator